MLKRIKKSSLLNLPLIIILGLASFLRFFRFSDLLGFWYDQGRDALVIWDFIHKGKFFLIGPTTGIEGVFRGPWYYWLISPFYWLGNGNPVYPSVFLIITSILSILVLYYVGNNLGGKKVGLLSAFLASCSVYIIGSSRWLSNPTPMFLISILLVWSIYKFLQKKVWALPLMGLLTGMALQFGSATEYFYLPAFLIIFVWKRKLLPKPKVILLSFGLMVLAFIPQLLFEIRHPGVLTGPIINFLINGKSGELSFWQLITTRIGFYYNLIASKFWLNGNLLFAPFLILVLVYLVRKWKTLKENEMFTALVVLLSSPFLGMLFFNGNSGNVYDYYFTGYYLMIILFFSFVFIKISETKYGKLLIFVFLFIFIYKNYSTYKAEYSISLNDPEIIAFENQLKAIDWIYKDAAGREFNVDEYVPPVIPYAYQYLFLWLGTNEYGSLPLEKNVPLLYTLYEVDPDHPSRLQEWTDRQKGIGNILKEERFGGIVVQERERIIFE